MPLSGVQIRILDKQGNIVYILTTDENGESQTIPLETIDKSFSQNPYFSGNPFTAYNVLAQASGFNSLYVSDIPVFELKLKLHPGEESKYNSPWNVAADFTFFCHLLVIP